MHELSNVYEDTEWHRKRDGVELPNTTPEAIKRLVRDKPWSEWGGIRLSNDRVYYVLPSGKPVLKSTIRRVLGQAETEHRLLTSYLSIPNGQVKNFINACRGSIAVGDMAYVAVVGSKASEGSGVWHRYYAMWLAMRCKKVVIDFYDYNEIPGTWEQKIGDSHLSCEWLAMGMTSEELERMGYNVIIDDVWTYETGSGLQNPPYSEFYSRKYASETDGARPFLHSVECRKFSHPPSGEKIAGCGCILCTEIKECSRNYDEYLYLRNMCSRLGHSAPCVGISFIQELNAVHALRMKLLTTGEYEITQNAEFRHLIALTEELAITVKGSFVRLVEGMPEYSSITRFTETPGSFEFRSYPWLSGKSVLFCGVPASIVGSTQIKSVRGPQSPDACDVVFFNSINSWKMQFAGRVVYVPANPVAVTAQIPDWMYTGRQIQNYYEYTRQEKPTEEDRAIPIGQYHRDLVYPPVDIFPVLESSYLPSPLGKFTKSYLVGKLYSVIKERWKVVVVPFTMRLWRSSIIVGLGSWTMVRLHPSKLYSMVSLDDQVFFREAACMLPWDMADHEVAFVERDYPKHRELREIYFQRRSVGLDVRLQGEFKLILSKSEPSLVRSSRAHPVSLTGWQKQEWQRLSQTWAGYPDFQVLEEVDRET